MLTKDFVNWFVHHAGQNYGYNIETSTTWQLTEEEIDTLYKEMYKEYGIDNILLFSNYCETCKEYNENTPYHLDFEKLLDLTKEENLNLINRKYWTEERIQVEIDKINKVREKLMGIEKNPNADLKKEAYSFYNLLSRVVDGREGNHNFLFVEKEYFDSIYQLEEQKINEFIDQWKARIDVVEQIEGNQKYKLHVM